jgi:hypothetical protein
MVGGGLVLRRLQLLAPLGTVAADRARAKRPGSIFFSQEIVALLLPNVSLEESGARAKKTKIVCTTFFPKEQRAR